MRERKEKKVIITVTNDLVQDQRMHRIASTLFKAGYSVEFIGRIRNNSLPILNFPYFQTRLKCWFSSGFLFYLEYNLRLILYLWRKQVDIMYSVDLDTMLAGGIISRVKKCKYVYDAHEYFTEVPELKNRPITKAIWSAIAQWSIPKTDIRLTVNSTLADLFADIYGKNFYTIMNCPITESAISYYKNTNRKEIIYQGVLNKGRGLEQSIKSMQILPDDFTLIIVGEGDLSDQLRQMVAELELGDKVVFKGWQLPSELVILTKEASIGLNLLDGSSLNYKLSLANKFFDYMHAEIPSICMNFPVYSTINDQYNVSVLIDKLDAQSIADAILSLSTDTAKFDHMVNQCRLAKDQYNWESESKKLLTIFNQL